MLVLHRNIVYYNITKIYYTFIRKIIKESYQNIATVFASILKVAYPDQFQ